MTRMQSVIAGILATIVIGGAAVPALAEPSAKNLLFYGNSFTMRNDVPASVARLATSAGHAEPVIFRNMAGGRRMPWHIEQTQSAPENNIADPAAEGGFDAVIFQGYSTEPTRLGDREAFVNNTLTLAGLVRKHDNGRNAAIVLYQTWARGYEHDMFPDRYEGPDEMQQDLIEGYEAARQALVEAHGESVVFVAPVGSAFESTDFDRQLYDHDIYHAGPVGSLLSAMVLYRTIYGGLITDIDEDALASAREASNWSSITEEQWQWIVEAADQCDIPDAALHAADLKQ